MKILHTSDLHIGKKLFGRERYEEYRAVFGDLYSACVEEGVELVLIAGDVFDTYTPPAEAEKIFYEGAKKLSEVAAVLVIGGNHDDYVRLCAASVLAEDAGVYIVGNDLKPVKCSMHKGAYPVRSGAGYVVFANSSGEEVYINTLPYPNEARFKEGKTEETFTEKMTRWIAAGEAGKPHGIPSVFLSHIFVNGGKVSDSEREIDLGGARLVPAEILPDCAYCALGHLHRRQKLGKNIYYSGAPMRFTFDESGDEKSFNVFDLTSSGVENFRQIPFKSAKKLVRLQANSAADGLKLLKKYPDAYAELTLNLTAPLTPDENSSLRQAENLISLRADVKTAEADFAKISNKNKSASQLFSEYYNSRYDADPPAELLELFLSMTEEE